MIMDSSMLDPYTQIVMTWNIAFLGLMAFYITVLL